MDCAESGPCQRLPSFSLWEREVRRQKALVNLCEVPPRGSDPNSTEGGLPDIVTRQLGVASEGGRETQLWGLLGQVWLRILLPCKEIVLR